MIDLTGEWQLIDETNTYDVAVQIPGDVHSALLEAGIIPDPFQGRNELEIQWVGRRGWTMRRWVMLDGDVIQEAERWILEFDVVDTVAEIFLNGHLVARNISMFVPLRVDVKDFLLPGDNHLEVRFDSPEIAAGERAALLPYPVPHQVYPHQSMHRNLLRKTQCHGSWDWGIAMMVSGIYDGARLRPTTEDDIRHVWTVPRRSTRSPAERTEADDVWQVPVHIEWDRPGLEPGDCAYPDGFPEMTVRLLDPVGNELLQHHVTSQDVASGSESSATVIQDTQHNAAVRVERSGEVTVTLSVERPHLWWPAGYGAQPIYTVEVSWGGGSRSLRTAFRTVEVVNARDETGASMFFRVNGRDVWAKGANWIPVDAFPARQTDDRYRALLEDAQRAYMNMIRVWGGGQYEPDVFYDICDELGLLVWQDFMFSCSLYPSEPWFMEEVAQEVRSQVKRLTSHPSIALWCGNNENIGALGWFEESLTNPGRYLIDFDRLNNGVVGREVRALDDTRVFWPSSPAAGEGDFSDNWHDDSSGDMHYWNVWHEGKPFSAYYEVTPRFCSEFGFQSFPSVPTVRSFAGEEHMNPTAPDVEHHQRHGRGNTVILETMSRYFRIPFSFEDFVYLSQVQQAMAISMAVTYWRSRRPVSMGALYWQLNDLWPVVSWSSIEYDGRWKLLHHEAKRFFAPLRVAVFTKDGMLEVHLLNDTADRISETVTIRGLNWSGASLWQDSRPVVVEPDAVTEVLRVAIAELPFDRTAGFVVATVERDAAGEDVAHRETAEAARDFALLCEYKQAVLRRPEITAHVDASGTRVTVHCSGAPAFWTAIELDQAAARLGDNGVLLLPGEERAIPIENGRPGLAVTAIRTIRDTYQ
ncbi:MAG: glycoside hydrolase family 2 protein [Alkalispirochaeta sp.]